MLTSHCVHGFPILEALQEEVGLVEDNIELQAGQRRWLYKGLKQRTHLFCLTCPSLVKLWVSIVRDEMMVRAALVKKFWTWVRARAGVFLCNVAYLDDLIHFLIVFLIGLGHMVGAAHHLAAVVCPAVARGGEV